MLVLVFLFFFFSFLFSYCQRIGNNKIIISSLELYTYISYNVQINYLKEAPCPLVTKALLTKNVWVVLVFTEITIHVKQLVTSYRSTHFWNEKFWKFQILIGLQFYSDFHFILQGKFLICLISYLSYFFSIHTLKVLFLLSQQ